jgi:tetratricopeptide (TPR) repeat protein
VTFQNAAPGTFFALFGVITIGFMFINSPELSFETLQQVTSPKIPDTSTLSGSQLPSNKLNIRGKQDFAQALEAQINLCEDHYSNKQVDKAITTCRETLSIEALNRLAWMYQERNQLEITLPLAQSAVALDERYSGALHTLAIIWCKKHHYEEAIEWLEQAIRLESKAEIKQKFIRDLENIRQQKCEISS